MQDPLVVLGEIVKAHGLRGEVKVRSEICDPENFTLPEVLLRAPDGTTEPVKVLSYRVQKGAFVLRLAGFSKVEQVSAKLGWEFICRGSQLPLPAADEYYHFQLLGLPVVAQNGDDLGRLTEIMATSAHEVYVIRPEHCVNGGSELLLPAVGAYIIDIDLDAGRIVVEPAGTGPEVADLTGAAEPVK